MFHLLYGGVGLCCLAAAARLGTSRLPSTPERTAALASGAAGVAFLAWLGGAAAGW